MKELGFPAPRVYAAGNYSYIPSTTKVLEENGIETSVSAMPRLVDEGAEYNYSALRDSLPYHPSYDDNAKPGNAQLVEVPVGFSEVDRYNVVAVVKSRLANVRRSGGVDVFQMVLAPWQTVIVGDTGQETQWAVNTLYTDLLEEFLRQLADMEGVRVETVSAAVRAWKKAQEAEAKK